MGGKGGGDGQLTAQQIDAQMRRQEEMMNRQMQMQQQFQRESEERMRQERERDRQAEIARRQRAADEREQQRIEEEQREAATFREMTGQASQEDGSDFGGGFNLDMPTIDRPDYEQEDRPL